MPKQGARRTLPSLAGWKPAADLPTTATDNSDRFLDVINSRQSATGGPVTDERVAAVLRHSTRMRFRREDGRFGTWESRTCPSAGGMSALRLLVLPIGSEAAAGLYDDARHALCRTNDLAVAKRLNAASVARLTSATEGTTIQLVASASCYVSCYDNASSLLWRDSGALCATIAFVATALSIDSIVLGRHGTAVVRAAGFDDGWQAAGAIHLGEPRP